MKKHKNHCRQGDIEHTFVEINLRKVKWLLIGIHHIPNLSDQYSLKNIKLILTGYFNAEETEFYLKQFMYINGEQSQPPSICYSNFAEFQKSNNKIKLGDPWVIYDSDSLVTITCSLPN